MYRKHRNEQCSQDDDGVHLANGDVTDNDTVGGVTDVVASSGQCMISSEERCKRAALFILKSKEERMLNQSTLDHLLTDITGTKVLNLHVASKNEII